MNKSQLIDLLASSGPAQQELFARARHIRDTTIGNTVQLRGLVEFSNICQNDCLYCGIRASNKKVRRYRLSLDEIIECAGFCQQAGIGSMVLQSGEVRTPEFIDFVVSMVEVIKAHYPAMAITLCVGEQTDDVYRQFFKAGAERYLLRIETSIPAHYQKLHPPAMSFPARQQCLKSLRDIGYQVGTGVMIGSPFQSVENLADDLLFFKSIDVDMVGMGPYLPHPDTPFGTKDETAQKQANRLSLSLNMVAALRLLMPDINIAATTALQVLSPEGRELGLLAGANVIMPQVTPEKYRKEYQLYANKPSLDESSAAHLEDLGRRIGNAGMVMGFNRPGHSLHFTKRTAS
jgi:biotin synthase